MPDFEFPLEAGSTDRVRYDEWTGSCSFSPEIPPDLETELLYCALTNPVAPPMMPARSAELIFRLRFGFSPRTTFFVTDSAALYPEAESLLERVEKLLADQKV